MLKFILFLWLLICATSQARPSCPILDKTLGTILCCEQSTNRQGIQQCTTYLPRKSFPLLNVWPQSTITHANFLLRNLSVKENKKVTDLIPSNVAKDAFRKQKIEAKVEDIIKLNVPKRDCCCNEVRQIVALSEGYSFDPDAKYEVYQELPERGQAIMRATCTSKFCFKDGRKYTCKQVRTFVHQFVKNEKLPEYLIKVPIQIDRECLCGKEVENSTSKLLSPKDEKVYKRFAGSLLSSKDIYRTNIDGLKLNSSSQPKIVEIFKNPIKKLENAYNNLENLFLEDKISLNKIKDFEEKFYDAALLIRIASNLMKFESVDLENDSFNTELNGMSVTTLATTNLLDSLESKMQKTSTNMLKDITSITSKPLLLSTSDVSLEKTNLEDYNTPTKSGTISHINLSQAKFQTGVTSQNLITTKNAQSSLDDTTSDVDNKTDHISNGKTITAMYTGITEKLPTADRQEMGVSDSKFTVDNFTTKLNKRDLIYTKFSDMQNQTETATLQSFYSKSHDQDSVISKDFLESLSQESTTILDKDLLEMTTQNYINQPKMYLNEIFEKISTTDENADFENLNTVNSVLDDKLYKENYNLTRIDYQTLKSATLKTFLGEAKGYSSQEVEFSTSSKNNNINKLTTASTETLKLGSEDYSFMAGFSLTSLPQTTLADDSENKDYNFSELISNQIRENLHSIATNFNASNTSNSINYTPTILPISLSIYNATSDSLEINKTTMPIHSKTTKGDFRTLARLFLNLKNFNITEASQIQTSTNTTIGNSSINEILSHTKNEKAKNLSYSKHKSNSDRIIKTLSTLIDSKDKTKDFVNSVTSNCKNFDSDLNHNSCYQYCQCYLLKNSSWKDPGTKELKHTDRAKRNKHSVDSNILFKTTPETFKFVEYIVQNTDSKDFLSLLEKTKNLLDSEIKLANIRANIFTKLSLGNRAEKPSDYSSNRARKMIEKVFYFISKLILEDLELHGTKNDEEESLILADLNNLKISPLTLNIVKILNQAGVLSSSGPNGKISSLIATTELIISPLEKLVGQITQTMTLLFLSPEVERLVATLPALFKGEDVPPKSQEAYYKITRTNEKELSKSKLCSERDSSSTKTSEDKKGLYQNEHKNQTSYNESTISNDAKNSSQTTHKIPRIIKSKLTSTMTVVNDVNVNDSLVSIATDERKILFEQNSNQPETSFKSFNPITILREQELLNTTPIDKTLRIDEQMPLKESAENKTSGRQRHNKLKEEENLTDQTTVSTPTNDLFDSNFILTTSQSEINSSLSYELETNSEFKDQSFITAAFDQSIEPENRLTFNFTENGLQDFGLENVQKFINNSIKYNF